MTPEPVPDSALPLTLIVTTDGSTLAAIDATELAVVSRGVLVPELKAGAGCAAGSDDPSPPSRWAPTAPPTPPPISAATRAIATMPPVRLAGRGLAVPRC